MNYIDYYEFVTNRLKYESVTELSYRIYQEVLELFDAANKNDWEELKLELGDIVFYTVALQSFVSEIISYKDLNFNDLSYNDIYDSVYEKKQLITRYLFFYISGLITFVYDARDYEAKIKNAIVVNDSTDENLQQLQLEQENLYAGLNFYSTVLFELIHTIAVRIGSDISEITELNIDKLINRDKNGK